MLPLLVLSGCGKKEATKPKEPEIKFVRIQKLEGVTDILARDFPATVDAKDTANISFRVSGLLHELPVEPGQTVKKGDIIAKLDPRDFQSTVTNLQGKVKGLESKLVAMKKGAREEDIQRLKANVAAAKANKLEAQQKYDRNSVLYEKSVIAAQEFEEFKASLEVAKSSLEVANKELEIGLKGAREEDIFTMESRIKALKSNLKIAKDALIDTVLLAPFDGVIAQTYPNAHEEISAGVAVAKLQNVSALEINIFVAENVMNWMSKHGANVNEIRRHIGESSVSFPTIKDKSFPVSLFNYETDADAATQTYEVTFILDGKNSKGILPGMNGTLKIEVKPDAVDIDASFLIPATAIFVNREGKTCVWIIDEKTSVVSERIVKSGGIVNANHLISTGVKAGETIAVTAANTLRSGMKAKELKSLRDL